MTIPWILGDKANKTSGIEYRFRQFHRVHQYINCKDCSPQRHIMLGETSMLQHRLPKLHGRVGNERIGYWNHDLRIYRDGSRPRRGLYLALRDAVRLVI